MHPGLGQHHDANTLLLVTRELRWFHRGPTPPSVLAWFLGLEGEHHAEHRTDHYDTAAAARGAGVKYRDATHMDSKFLLSRRRDLPLPASLVGVVDDWVKISSPISPDTDIAASSFLPVAKDILTLIVPMPDQPAGCEIELVSIRTGEIEAWSLCLETFGPPEQRSGAFRLGVDTLAGFEPAPVEIVSPNSYGYPEWITDLALTT